MEQSQARTAALAFLQSNQAGVLSTVSPEGKPHGSVIYYVADDAFNIYFLTKINSRKYRAMQAQPAVAFTIGRLDKPQTLQIEGIAEELRSTEEQAAHVPDLLHKLTETNQRAIPIAKMDAEVVVMWIQPKWVRWGDFTVPALGNDQLFTEISLA